MHPKELITMMEAELIEAGFVPLKNKQQVVDHFENHQGTTLLVVNSMCGCAGPDARMGAIEALATTHYQPEHLVTVFPGVDEEATMAIQQYIQPYPLSSPAIAVIKDGEVVHFLERHQIKGKPSNMVAEELLVGLEDSCNCCCKCDEDSCNCGENGLQELNHHSNCC
jgi:putative YphP/YqiW family bacilliredoxin